MNSLINDLKSTFFHLRFSVSFAFLPIFLWAYALSEGDITKNFWYGILILHLLVYPASNGIYAYFDKRKGVISGIRGIKPASIFTLVVSLIFLVVGIYLSLKVNTSYFYAVLIFVLLSFLFSFPSTGIKIRPLYGILIVSISYGVVGFIAGWVCGSDLGKLKDWFYIAGVLASAGFVAGFYTLSLVYRVSEDSEKMGDLFVEKLGSAGVFRFAEIMLPISGLLATIVVAGKFTLYELIGVILYFLIWFLVIDRFRVNFYLQKEWQNYKTIMNFNLTNSVILSIYLFLRILAFHYLLID
jgi:1,4-dihydroxy-2-naphthoate octaprenyltransferase